MRQSVIKLHPKSAHKQERKKNMVDVVQFLKTEKIADTNTIRMCCNLGKSATLNAIKTLLKADIIMQRGIGYVLAEDWAATTEQLVLTFTTE